MEIINGEVWIENTSKDNDEEKDIVTSIFEAIREIGRSYNLASIHAGMGFNTGDILDALAEKYNNVIIPKINTLSNNDKEKLVSLINPLLEDPSISKRFIEELIDQLNNKKNSR